MVGVVAYVLLGAVVAVHEGGVGAPGVGGLVLELCAVGVGGVDSALDFMVDGFFDLGYGFEHFREALADVLWGVSCWVVAPGSACPTSILRPS